MKHRASLIYKNCEVCGERFPASIGSMERYCSVGPAVRYIPGPVTAVGAGVRKTGNLLTTGRASN